MTNNPDPDDLFCPSCGDNIDYDTDHELDALLERNLYLHHGVYLYLMTCGAIVQDGEFLNKTEAREKFA